VPHPSHWDDPAAPHPIPILEVNKRVGVSQTDIRAGIGIGAAGDPMFTLQAGAQHGVAQPVAYRKSRRAQSTEDHETWVEDEVTNTLNTFDLGDVRTTQAVVQQSPMVVRRLTPVECERLQGFPDGWTDILYRGKPAPDGPRYKALGNSMAVPVIRWLGERIMAVEANMGNPPEV
jgi:DNA (cytosine-5)-methyltransferase 1